MGLQPTPFLLFSLVIYFSTGGHRSTVGMAKFCSLFVRGGFVFVPRTVQMFSLTPSTETQFVKLSLSHLLFRDQPLKSFLPFSGLFFGPLFVVVSGTVFC